MSEDQPKQSESGEILKSDSKLKVYLDTNVIIAYLDERHPFHYEAKVIIDPLKQEECYFFIHYLCIGEFISSWRKLKNESVNKIITRFEKFLNLLKHYYRGGQVLHVDTILKNYKEHSRHIKLLSAQLNDFLILTAAAKIKNIKIITCDRGMYKAGRRIFRENIYYLPFATSKGRSDLSRFIKDMEEML